jgi:glycosyltransferase involved in cell wall biosynthesis
MEGIEADFRQYQTKQCMESLKKNHKYVLITSSNFPAGGAAANYLNLFCKGVVANGFYISVFLLKGFAFGSFANTKARKNITDYGTPYTYLGSTRRPKNKFLKLFDEFVSLLRLTGLLFSLLKNRKQTTILIYNSEIQSNIPIFLLAKIFRIRIVTFIPEFYDKSVFYGSFFRRIKWYGFLLNFYYLNKLSYKLIVFSHFLKEEYINKGFSDNNILVQPNLTDFDFWIDDGSEIKYTIGYSGTPSVKDGLYDLFKAINLLQSRSVDVSLLVIGDVTFGESLIPKLKMECQRLGILEKVTFAGLVESLMVKKYLAECKILAITRPSLTQTRAGFPTKLGEYFATKRPVLTTNFGDIEKYFENDIDLVMAESGNPDSIAGKIQWMLENAVVLDQIAKQGVMKAKELLDYNSSVTRMIQFINE